MFAYFGSRLSWPDLVTRTVKETIADDGIDLAAQLAYYFFLALFPALLFVVALASFFPLQHFADSLTGMLSRFTPGGIATLVGDQLKALSENKNGGLLSIGFLGAFWSASAALVSIIDALNRAYDIDEQRPWWKSRLTAIGLTLALAVFILLSFTLVLAGPEIADYLGRHLGLASAFTMSWKILQWPIAFLLVSTAFALVYYFGPDAEQEWVWITPGSVAATVLWLLVSLAFRFYVINFGNYDKAYGTLGAIIMTLLWFYLTGLVMIIGAEMNAEIEHASPWGKQPGEKVPGGKSQRRRIGLAAAREWFRTHPDTPISAH